MPPSCAYTDDASFCKCLGNYDCGGITAKDSGGTVRSVFCGGCQSGQWCVPGATLGVGIGNCGCTDPIAYQWQRDKINMMISMGENDNTTLNYASCSNIGDGRGYTIGQVGFCTGTGDFILVAACYNDRKPNNELSKYWNALVGINDTYVSTGANQGSTATLDALGNFCGDLATATADSDGVFVQCQVDVGDALYRGAALAHAAERGFEGLLTMGFLYDTELNFGEQDDTGPPVLGGTKTVMAKADADYGSGLPANFAGKPWEESRWLGFMIQERVVEMSGNRTWKRDLDQNGTWEGARRTHTAMSNSPESGTDLSMEFDITSEYKAGATTGGLTPCWAMPPLLSNYDTQSSVYTVGLDKSASATDQSKWKAVATTGPMDNTTGTFVYASCPANPTP
jgi:hypothetical protein